MAESSGNAKLVIGVVVGAVVAVGLMFALGRGPVPTPPAAKAVAPEVKLPKVAPEAPPVTPAQAPKPATEVGDWRGKVEVGRTVVAAPSAGVAPHTSSDIRDFLKALAKGSGGAAALKALVNATYTVERDGRTLSFDVLGAQGVLMQDPAHLLQAVWRPDSCVERRRGASGPCHMDVLVQARAAFIAHTLAVVAPVTTTDMKPVRVESGLDNDKAWTSLLFTMKGSAARLAAFYDTQTMKLRYGALVWRPQDMKIKQKHKPDEFALLPGVIVDAHAVLDGWRTLDAGVRLPATWCELDGKIKPPLDNSKLEASQCVASLHVVSVVPSTAKLALVVESRKIRAAVGSVHRLAEAPAAVGAALLDSVKVLDNDIKEHFFASAAGGMFVVRGGVTSFARDVTSAYPGKVRDLLARPRVAIGHARFSITDVAAGVAAFEKSVVAAGFTPIPGLRLVFPDTSKKPDAASPIEMIVEVPVAP